MAKSQQALILEPTTELRFIGPFTDVVTADLKLTNPTDKRIYFKVKTTAPKCYCVRPNTGILEPKETATVAVMLQPFEHEPSGKATLKFMVLSMYAPEGRIESQDQLWKDAPPDSVMDTKLICVFDMPESVPLPPSYQDIDCMQDDKSSVGSGSDEVERLREEVKRLTARVNSLRAENLRLKVSAPVWLMVLNDVRLQRVAMLDTVHSRDSSTAAADSS
ncbi:hypothetical protein BaRGS_00010649 [Batillaria attramentaria]|uniref:MSP domain-containing protein n=1 Tax=Batillaria attramentaria TaxID=370345 RepID=A0ABD0LFT6_9CAEN